MTYYIGLDVSKKETAFCVVNQEGGVVREDKVETNAGILAIVLKEYRETTKIVGIEAGPYSRSLTLGLRAHGYNVVIVDSRRMGFLLKANINKTDRNDARVIAKAMRAENYREVHVKSDKSVEMMGFLGARECIVEVSIKLKNELRGLFRAYGVNLKSGEESFRKEVKKELKNLPELARVGIESLLKTWINLSEERAKLDKLVEEEADHDDDTKLLMTIPGVGPVTALTFKTVIDDPSRFENSRTVGAYVGCTPTQYASGETVIQGRISRQGPKQLRRLLVGSAIVLLTRCSWWSHLRASGVKKMKKLGTKKAAVAVGRKLAIIMHRMLITKEPFRVKDPFAALEPKKGKKHKASKTKNVA